jgi:glycosyltransferase involved in cell wall biosynthesis
MANGKKKEKSMRIGIDGRLWNQTGVGRYIRNISLNLSEIDNKNEYVLFVRTEDRKEIEALINKENWKIVSANIRWHSLKEQLDFPKIIQKENVDVVHFPYFSVPFFYKKPFVVTIHDLILHHFISGESSTLPLWLYGFKMLGYKIIINNAARKARKVIAVSDSTRNEIYDHLMVNKKNVEVIYEAADDFNFNNTKKLDLGKYFLYVGNVYPHKNVDKLVKAFKELLNDKQEIKLVFVGREDYFYKKLKKQVSKLVDKKQIIFIENPTDEELASYYKNAICLVRPSLMEGFSLPPLEALESGGLVLASDIPVHKEIFEDTIFYFNPKSAIDIKDKMQYALNLDSKTREEKIKKGKELAKKFSWKKTALKTLEVYESSAGLR